MTFRGTLAVVSLVALVACEKADKISTGSLSGRAVYAGQSDHSGISVTAAGFTTVTDATGNYAFADVPVGRHAVLAVAPRSAERTMATTVSVSGGANTAPELSFTPMQVLAGQLTVMGTPVQGATVTLDGGATTTTDANGIYSFASATPGVHSLSFVSGANADGIPTVLYSPDTGASVPAPYSYEQLFRLQPFDLQNARRVASVNLKVPYREIHFTPTLSPNGLLYFYGTSNDQGSTNVYVGSATGGAPVLVTDNAHSGYAPKFSPTSSHLAFVRRVVTSGSPDRYELHAAKINAGPSVETAPPLTTSFQPGNGWEFSPQIGSTPSVYFIEQNSLREVSVTPGAINIWNGVTAFWLSSKQHRIVFKQASGTTYRLVSAPTDGTAYTNPPTVYETTTADFAMTFHGFSPNESDFAYWNGAGPGLTVGLKIASTIDAHAEVTLSNDASVSCVTFNPDGTRLAWDRGGANGMVTSPTASASVAGYRATAARTGSCPMFTEDGNIWLRYTDSALPTILQILALAPADASAAPTAFWSATTSAEVPYTAQFSRKAAVFMIRSGSVGQYYAKTLADAPVQFDTAQYYYYTGLQAFPATGDGAIYWKYDPSNNWRLDAFWVGFASGVPAGTRIAMNCTTTGGLPTSRDGKKALMWNSDVSGGSVTVSVVDLATGVKKPLTRQATSYAALQDVGATPATKFIGFRTNTPGPYEFQDGIYISDP